MSSLSQNDQQILGMLFSREEGVPAEVAGPAPSGTAIDAESLARLRKLEVEAVQLAEENKLDEALERIDQVVAAEPRYASAYNNRAQILRLLQRPAADALAEVDRAIALASGDAAVLRQAHAQRGAILKSTGQDDAADAEFARAAQLGSDVARQMVKQNPYAQLCNAMVSQMMQPYAAQRQACADPGNSS